MSTNHLSSEISPYLLQHQHNPVWWHPWGQEAFDLAASEDKPIFLSVGYATCHWCHVMEGDSFEKQDVADILNEHFVCIKVDREERPDIDAIYMKAVQMLTGRGGWPMSVMMTPDRTPFWGGTFIPRAQFKGLLQEVAKLWHSPDRDKLVASAQEITGHLHEAKKLNSNAAKTTQSRHDLLQRFYYEANRSFDEQYAGFGDAPKFPPAMAIMLLLGYARRQAEDNAARIAYATLDAMARGGIRDSLGGGFHRYATDSAWLIPHFEKMLYDNALLVLAYTRAFQDKQLQEYADVVHSTLAYVLRDMRHPDGGFYSAEDADSEKTEGKFYVWSAGELQQLLTTAEYEHISKLYNVQEQGNFAFEQHAVHLEEAAGMRSIHNVNILHLNPSAPLPSETSDKLLATAFAKMRDARAQRVRPLLDDKVIVAWNGLMISAFGYAGLVFNNNEYIEAARQALAFVRKHLSKDHKLSRIYRDGQTRYQAQAEDYAFLIQGIVDFYEATSEREYLDWALALQKQQDALFSDPETGTYFDTDDSDATLLMRPRDVIDNATPSANSVAALNLLRLARFTCDFTMEKAAQKLLDSLTMDVGQYPRAFPYLLLAVDYAETNPWIDESCPVAKGYLHL